MQGNAYEGVIVKGVGGIYYARDNDAQTHVLRAKGKFRKQRIKPMVGDRILFSPRQGDEHGWIEEILPRQTQLVRPPVANIKYVLIVLSPEPAPDYLLLDTLLVMAVKQGISPVLVINKCDIDETLIDAVRCEYQSLNIPILSVSAVTGQGIEALQEVLKAGICCLAGQSGVGKSTLLSAATGLELQTGEISKKISRGKHTTRHAELMFSGDYQVLDTPGFSLLDLWDGLEPIQLKDYYPEFAPYEGQCKFAPCYHLSEPGCAVLQATEEGKLGKQRLQRYHTLLKKAQEDWKNRYD